MKIEARPAGTVGPASTDSVTALPVYAVAALTSVFIWFSGLVEVSYESRVMSLLLNMLLDTGVCAWAGALALRGYLASGQPEMLHAGCGLVAMGSSFFISSLIIGSGNSPNHAAIVRNLGVFCAAIFHLAAALHAGEPRDRKPDSTLFKAASAYLGVLALTGFFWAAAQYDLSPAFYVPGKGPTPVQQLVLTLSVALLAVAAAFLIRHASRRGSLSLRYYGLGLGLIALGFVDVSVAAPGSVLSWAGRASQGVGHLFLLAAFSFAVRSAVQKGLDVREAAADYYLESEDHYRTLVNALRAAVISLDPKERVVLWNTQAEVISGYSYAEASGRPLSDLIAPDGGGETLRNALKERSGRYLETTLRRKDGVEFPADVLVFAAGGGWTKWTNLIIRETSDRKQAEVGLRRYELLSENSRDIILYIQRDNGRILEANAAAIAAYGYSREELLSLAIQDLRTPETTAQAAAQMVEADSKGVLFETSHRRKDGSTFSVEVSSQGATIGGTRTLVSVVRDITGRKRTEDALRQKDLRIRQALQVSRSFAFEWNPVTDEVSRSEECRPLLGLNGDEAIRDSGEIFFKRVHSDDRERYVSVLHALTPDSPSYITKYRLERPDGRVITLEETGLGSFDAAGRLTRLTGITTDVTDREKAEAELSYLASFPGLNPNPIIEADLDGHVRFCNSSAAGFFPDLPQRGKNHPWLSDWRTVTEILGEGRQNRLERQVTIGGKWYFQTLHFIPESRSVRVYGVDITGLQEAEQALRSTHERLVTILESISDGFFSLDRQWRVVFINEKGAQVLGQTLETMLGRVLWEIFPDAVGSDFERAYQRTMNERLTTTLESFYAPLNAWFEARAYPTVDGLSVFFRDVTDRRRVEQTLRESQTDLNWAQAVGQIGSWRLNVRRNELLWSDENYRIFGLPAGTPLTYETFLAMVHPGDREFVDRKWTATLRGEPYDIEHRIIVGHTVKWVRERAELEFDLGGQLLGGFGITQDITAKKLSEQALEKSLLRFELLARTAEELLQTREPQKIVAELCTRVMEFLDCQVFFNFLADEQAGYLRLNAWAGIPVEEARRIERLDYGVAVCGCAARDGCRIVAEYITTTPDVRTELVKSWGIKAYACYPLLGAGEKAIGTLSFGTRNRETFSEDDLTLMKAVSDQVTAVMVRMLNEQALRESEEALRKANEELEETVRRRTAELEDTVATLKNEIVVRKKIQTQLHQLSRVFMDAADPIIIEDLSGTVVEMNSEAELAYGYSREELIGKPVTTLFIPEHYDQAAKLRGRCYAGEEIRNWESTRKAKSGRIIPSFLTAFPLMDEYDKIAFVATICKDISARKQMEAMLVESQQHLKNLSRKSLEALEADRQTVARELHDSIGGSLAAIKFGLEEVAEQATRDPVYGVASLGTLISHLTDTIKETKRISANLRPLMLDDLGLLATIDWYTRQSSQRYGNIRLIQQIDVPEHEIPEEYKIVVYRVMQEAVTNASKHGRADTIYIRLKRGAGHFEFEVEDNGCGFDLREVFNRKDQLSGFGLRSMQERAEICGGILNVSTQPGEGTSIKVTLPA